ncbi:hypothetical protein KUTeg_004983 [Tegillarca granosa]|uniref:UDENN domain-containing protein n=1 Tax=Tegillarca granosa TaxID=220873 RepID=A0ABQ9FIG1_TEGGR|nr:hypothetical protein KUTeg_004983 [Tegillarca granosa]
MAALCELISAGLIVSQEDREFYLQKSQIASSTEHYVQYLYSQWKKKWYYIYTCDVQDGDNLPKVTQFSLVLVTKDFNPEKYEMLSKILTKRYRKSGNPSYMLESYLSVITRGTCSAEENGKFFVRDFERNKALGNCHLKDIIESLGVETIILYTALLLKKRIVVYYPQNQISSLLNCVRSLPSLVWHRQNWEIAYPFLELNQAELDELKLNSCYVAGFCDASVEGRSDLYDVFLNVTTAQISIAPSAKESLAMGKLHKDIAMFIVKCADNEDLSEQQIVKEIEQKTSELLNNLKSLCETSEDGKKYLTLESLNQRKMAPATENFLFSLAACEGLVKL